MMIKSYSELKKIRTFDGRYEYLKLQGIIGETTFGFDRYMNQLLYNSRRWKKTRDIVIIRDKGCDLGIEGLDIHDRILVHHMNPITISDIENESDIVFNPEFLITTNIDTHNAIHYGNEHSLRKTYIDRKP